MSRHKRVSSQVAVIRTVLKDGQWHSAEAIADITGYKLTSVSATIRNLRKPGFGAHEIRSEQRGPLFMYRMVA